MYRFIIAVFLIIFVLQPINVFGVEEPQYWYKGGDDSFKHRLSTGTVYRDSSDPWASIIAHAYLGVETGIERIRVFARKEAAEKEYPSLFYDVEVFSLNGALKNIDSRKEFFWIFDYAPHEAGVRLLPDVIYELLGTLPGVGYFTGTVITNDYVAGVDYWSPSNQEWKVRTYNSFGLDENEVSIPLSADIDVADYTYNNTSKGFSAKLLYHLDQSWTNFNVRAWGQVYYDVYDKIAHVLLSVRSAYPTVDHTVRTIS